MLLLVNLALLPDRSHAVPSRPLQIVRQTQTAALCPAELSVAIDAVLDRPTFARSRWGALVQTLGGDRPSSISTLYTREADQYFIPASTAKLLTTAAVLKGLGSQFRFRTSIYGTETPTGWTLHLVGQGDPSFTERQLQQLTQQLSQRGIRPVGQLVVEDAEDPGDRQNSTWTWEDVQSGYGAPVNRLILDENALNLTLIPQALGQPLRVEWENPEQARGWQIINRSVTVDRRQPEFTEVGRVVGQPILTVKGQLWVGSAPDLAAVAIVNPGQNFLDRWQQTLAKANIRVDRAMVVNRPLPHPALEVAAVQSASLPELLKTMNQESNNLYAESLLRSLGATQPADPHRSSLELGLAALTSTLTRLGVDADRFMLVDGAGLSRANLMSPAGLVQTLQVMARQPEARMFRDSLSVAGVSGTLANRFRGTPAEGIVQAKTGTLSDAVALAGYVNPPHHPPLAFSLMLNHYPASNGEARRAIDEVVVLLAKLRSCPPSAAGGG
jgi:serine-type D-Ala-D-Ala carboxypeptidase/endopeptidase (penicillin-binding protein 4)